MGRASPVWMPRCGYAVGANACLVEAHSSNAVAERCTRAAGMRAARSFGDKTDRQKGSEGEDDADRRLRLTASRPISLRTPRAAHRPAAARAPLTTPGWSTYGHASA